MIAFMQSESIIQNISCLRAVEPMNFKKYHSAYLTFSALNANFLSELALRMLS
jgi:hypothetical protein